MGNALEQSGLEPFVLFLDENHCRNRRLLEVLHREQIQVVSYLDTFPASKPDAEWVPEVASRCWCLLTSDIRIRYNHLEKRAVAANGMRMFYFTRNNIKGEAMATALERALPAMQELFRREPAPFIAAITRRGEVSVRVSHTDF